MKNNDKDDDLFIVCSCSQLNHLARFSRTHDIDGFNYLYLHVVLADDISFWRKLKAAVRFLFGNPCNYGNMSEIVLTYDNLADIKAWIGRAEEAMKSEPKKNKHIGSSLESLFKELGESEEVQAMVEKKLLELKDEKMKDT